MCMRACYFGPPTARLFGVFEEPATDISSDVGVVLCYPFGVDYAAAFRSFRTLANRLSRRGFHVLRFDYFGTGDSSGEIEDTSISQWTSDVTCAIQEFRSSLNLREVSVVGLRLGATLATLASAECKHADRLVLWEPVIDGRSYMMNQLALHRAWLDEEIRDGRKVQSTDDELLGYQLTQRLKQDFEDLSLLSFTHMPAPDIYVLSQSPSTAHESLIERLKASGARVASDYIEGPTIHPRNLLADGGFEHGMKAIVAWLTSTTP